MKCLHWIAIAIWVLLPGTSSIQLSRENRKVLERCPLRRKGGLPLRKQHVEITPSDFRKRHGHRFGLESQHLLPVYREIDIAEHPRIKMFYAEDLGTPLK